MGVAGDGQAREAGHPVIINWNLTPILSDRRSSHALPQTYIIIGAVVLFGIGILSAVKRTRPKDPPAHTSGGRRADDA
jgi:hypothetical protein